MTKEIKITTLNATILWETEKNGFDGQFITKESRDMYAKMEGTIDGTTNYSAEKVGTRTYVVYTNGKLPSPKLANLCAAMAMRILNDIGMLNLFLVGNVTEEIFREMHVNENIQNN